jgi:hypothetical protein
MYCFMQHTINTTGDLKRQREKLSLSMSCRHTSYRRNIKYAPFVLKIGDKWRSLVDIRLRPLYFRKRSPVPTEREAGWAPETPRHFGEEKNLLLL